MQLIVVTGIPLFRAAVREMTLQIKGSFPLNISLVNVTKYAEIRFCHIY